MAQVWVARMQGDLGFQRLVAIKAILAQHALDPRFQNMFLDEARLVTGIHHPNVAQILDLGEQNEVLYHVLEWIEGDSASSLRRVAHGRGEKLPLGVVLRIVSCTCAGLHAAHELRDGGGRLLGVVHRDVSPANVLLSSSGEVKVIDFGIAKSVDRISEETSAGVLKGKVTYMAPEQVLGKDLDRRADVWACGVMLYQLLSGKLPYDAENQIATLHLLIQGMPPAPLKGVPEEVAELVYTALAYTPEGRFETADEMHRALESVIVQRCGTVTASDIARYVEQQLGERIGKRKQTIERALRAADERAQIAGEYEQVVPTESSLRNVPELKTPASLRTAETPFVLASAAEEPPISSARSSGEALGLVDLGASDQRAIERFGTRSRLPLVLCGLIAVIALVGYAGYLVWDRVALGEIPELPADR
jgi:eukaryotic-like serine/threonine-protein kinase